MKYANSSIPKKFESQIPNGTAIVTVFSDTLGAINIHTKWNISDYWLLPFSIEGMHVKIHSQAETTLTAERSDSLAIQCLATYA